MQSGQSTKPFTADVYLTRKEEGGGNKKKAKNCEWTEQQTASINLLNTTCDLAPELCFHKASGVD